MSATAYVALRVNLATGLVDGAGILQEFPPSEVGSGMWFERSRTHGETFEAAFEVAAALVRSDLRLWRLFERYAHEDAWRPGAPRLVEAGIQGWCGASPEGTPAQRPMQVAGAFLETCPTSAPGVVDDRRLLGLGPDVALRLRRRQPGEPGKSRFVITGLEGRSLGPDDTVAVHVRAGCQEDQPDFALERMTVNGHEVLGARLVDADLWEACAGPSPDCDDE